MIWVEILLFQWLNHISLFCGDHPLSCHQLYKCCSWLPILLMFIQLFLGNFLVCEPCPLHDFVGDFNGLSILCLGKLLPKPWWPKQWSRNLKSPPKNTLNLYPHNKNSLLWNLSISMNNFSKTKVTIDHFKINFISFPPLLPKSRSHR